MQIKVEYHDGKVMHRHFTDAYATQEKLVLVGDDGKKRTRVIYKSAVWMGTSLYESYYVRLDNVYVPVDAARDKCDFAYVESYSCQTFADCVTFVEDALGSMSEEYDVSGIAGVIFKLYDGEYRLLDQYRSMDGLYTSAFQRVLDKFAWFVEYECRFTRDVLADMAPGLTPEQYDELGNALVKLWKDNMAQDVADLRCGLGF